MVHPNASVTPSRWRPCVYVYTECTAGHARAPCVKRQFMDVMLIRLQSTLWCTREPSLKVCCTLDPCALTCLRNDLLPATDTSTTANVVVRHSFPGGLVADAGVPACSVPFLLLDPVAVFGSATPEHPRLRTHSVARLIGAAACAERAFGASHTHRMHENSAYHISTEELSFEAMPGLCCFLRVTQ